MLWQVVHNTCAQVRAASHDSIQTISSSGVDRDVLERIGTYRYRRPPSTPGALGGGDEEGGASQGMSVQENDSVPLETCVATRSSI